MKKNLERKFLELFKSLNGTKEYFAPGRVNLIGEHTDYNGGHVFPCAITIGTHAIARLRNDNRVRIYSMNFEEIGVVEFNTNDLVYREEHDWANYPKAVMKSLQNNNYEVNNGVDIVYFGNIPNGAGLSSSASIEILTAVIIKDLLNLDIKMLEITKICQEAENKFIGVNCGIMDQFIIGMGKKESAILLNTSTLDFKYASLKLKDISIVIANTNKPRQLAESKYNERRAECESALSKLKRELDINTLGDLTEQQFEEYKYLINNKIEVKRAKHAVYENQRTIKAYNALIEGYISEFGRLMNESHISLRDDYEVTGKELDTLVELAWDNNAIGSRMTGAGFGGCTVSLVYNTQIDDFINIVGKKYKDIIGYEASFYVVSVGDGAKKLSD